MLRGVFGADEDECWPDFVVQHGGHSGGDFGDQRIEIVEDVLQTLGALAQASGVNAFERVTDELALQAGAATRKAKAGRRDAPVLKRTGFTSFNQWRDAGVSSDDQQQANLSDGVTKIARHLAARMADGGGEWREFEQGGEQSAFG